MARVGDLQSVFRVFVFSCFRVFVAFKDSAERSESQWSSPPGRVRIERLDGFPRRIDFDGDSVHDFACRAGIALNLQEFIRQLLDAVEPCGEARILRLRRHGVSKCGEADPRRDSEAT